MRNSNLSPHLRQVLGQTDPDVIEPENEDWGLPSQTNGDYEPYGRAANKPLVSVHFVTPDGCIRSFQYRHLDSDSRFDRQRITLRFLGYRPTVVLIEGQHLWELYSYLHQDRTPWIMAAARNFPEKGKPFVSKLTFIDITEPVP
jgi:hypothetical protein